MNLTPEQIIAAISVAETVIDLALPMVGQPELVPVVTAAGELSKKLVTLITAHAQQTLLQAAVAAIRVEADAAEALKFPKG